jgi:hypothetical protein
MNNLENKTLTENEKQQIWNDIENRIKKEKNYFASLFKKPFFYVAATSLAFAVLFLSLDFKGFDNSQSGYDYKSFTSLYTDSNDEYDFGSDIENLLL